MNIAIIGAGNVAWHISRAFIKAGHPVKQIWSRNPENAVSIAVEIGANSIPNLSQISEKIDIVVLAVSDEAIVQVAKELKLNENQILVHTSGSTSIDILKSYANKFGVIYPLQTFSKSVEQDFSKIPVCIEGSHNEVTEVLLSIAKGLSNNTQVLSSEDRIKLHIAAVFASNFTNYFYSIAEDYIVRTGMSFDVLKPLIEATAKKAINGSPTALQTGPARRNDQITMDKHLNMLNNNPELKSLYEIVSQNIVKMYN